MVTYPVIHRTAIVIFRLQVQKRAILLELGGATDFTIQGHLLKPFTILALSM